MASFVKLPAGSWRAIVRRKSRYISETFRRKDDARAWALDAERQIDRGEAPKASRTARLRTFGDLIDLHIEDMKEVGRAPGRPAFTRACQDLAIKDLHFHDLRHEGTSRLFEAGFAIEQVALVTGHKDWKMLRRYTHLKPESLHAMAASRAA